MPRKFCVAFNGDVSFADKLRVYADSVYELFGTDGSVASGRGVPQVKESQFSELIAKLSDMGVRFNFLFSCPAEAYVGNKEFFEYSKRKLEWLKEIGVKTVTFLNPMVPQMLLRDKTAFELATTLSAQIHSASQVKAYKNYGFQRILIAEECTHHIRNIKEIVSAASYLPCELHVNNACVKSCIFRTEHLHGDLNFIRNAFYCPGYTSGQSLFNYVIVRPQDVAKYEALGIKYFKLGERQCSGEINLKALERYVDFTNDNDFREYSGLYYIRNFDRRISDKEFDAFFDFIFEHCQSDCSRCSFCQEESKRVEDRCKISSVGGGGVFKV
jgi:collagenase-like PrtC family protease